MQWGGDDFVLGQFHNLLYLPYKHTAYFDSNLLPIRRTIAVYGRPGVGKKEAVQLYCKQRDITNVATVNVVFGKTRVAVAELERLLALQREANDDDDLDMSDMVVSVIIIDHADVLVFEPDNEESMLFALQLETEAARHGILIVCLFDRVPDTEQASTVMTKHFQHAFFNQFAAGASCMIPAPNPTFRTAFLKQTFETIYRGTAPRLYNLALTDADYVILTDATVAATSRDMIEFVQRVFYTAMSMQVLKEGGTSTSSPFLIDMAFVQQHLKTSIGIMHILSHDPRDVENIYSSAASVGRGPMYANNPHRAAAMQPQNVTSFNQGLVEKEKALDTIVKKRDKKQQKRVRLEEEKEDEEAAAWMEAGVVKLMEME